MLSELTVHNLAIIDKLNLRFGSGFSVLTGETGAGKSIIIDAVSLLLGGRGEAEVVRSGADRAAVEGTFLLDAEIQAMVGPLLAEDGLEGDEPGTLLLGREVRREGRNVARVNGRTVGLEVLQGFFQAFSAFHGSLI